LNADIPPSLQAFAAIMRRIARCPDFRDFSILAIASFDEGISAERDW
jgi:hypothetical protein